MCHNLQIMNKHLHFNEDDEVEFERPVHVEDAAGEVTVQDDSGFGSDDDDEWVNNEDDEDDDDDDDEGSESSQFSFNESFVNIRTHVRALNGHRADVNMEKFIDLGTHLGDVEELDLATRKTLTGRVAEFIGWTMYDNDLNQDEAVHHIVNTPLGVVKYLSVLKGPNCGLKNGTVYNTLLDIGRWASYLAIYENKNVDKLSAILKLQQKSENKRKKRDIQERLTRENLVKNNQWPKDGMSELNKLLMQHKKRVDRTIQKAANGELLSDEDVIFVNDWVVALLFVGNPQGRAQAINALSLEQGQQLCGGMGQVTSTKLKTLTTFGVQAINCNPMTQQYIEAYVSHIRPYFLSLEPCTSLFVNTKGKPHRDIGVCVTRIFHSISKYHITTTTLRSLFETEACEAMDTGKLTPSDCAHVIRNNGHGAATSQNYYLKRKAEDSGRKAVEVHAKLYGTDQRMLLSPPLVSPGVDATFVPSGDASDDDALLKDDFRPRRRRIDWTVDEMTHLSAWIAQFEMDRGRSATKDWRACLKAMTMHATDFHSLHLTKVALREAWRREVKKQPQSQARVVIVAC